MDFDTPSFCVENSLASPLSLAATFFLETRRVVRNTFFILQRFGTMLIFLPPHFTPCAALLNFWFGDKARRTSPFVTPPPLLFAVSSYFSPGRSFLFRLSPFFVSCISSFRTERMLVGLVLSRPPSLRSRSIPSPLRLSIFHFVPRGFFFSLCGGPSCQIVRSPSILPDPLPQTEDDPRIIADRSRILLSRPVLIYLLLPSFYRCFVPPSLERIPTSDSSTPF